MLASGDLLGPDALAGMGGGNTAPQMPMQPDPMMQANPATFMENAALPSSDIAPL
jgi:hypothetical protein